MYLGSMGHGEHVSKFPVRSWSFVADDFPEIKAVYGEEPTKLTVGFWSNSISKIVVTSKNESEPDGCLISFALPTVSHSAVFKLKASLATGMLMAQQLGWFKAAYGQLKNLPFELHFVTRTARYRDESGTYTEKPYPGIELVGYFDFGNKQRRIPNKNNI